MVILLCIFFIVILIHDSATAINGALTGLSLWYNNVIPLLLPFMLISNVMVSHVSKSNKSAITTTFFLGILCGYPLGAKTTADFVQRNSYSSEFGNIILPLCNNTSPIFLSGYIINNILCGRISLIKSLLMIYLPYIIATVFQILISYPSYKEINKNQENHPSVTNSEDNELIVIRQITYVGFYIIICSIIAEFILFSKSLPNTYKVLLASITEITRGAKLIKDSLIMDTKIKTALILSLTSFGGISSILQTNKVIKGTRLSINRYIFVKVLCSIGTYCLTILFI